MSQKPPRSAPEPKSDAAESQLREADAEPRPSPSSLSGTFHFFIKREERPDAFQERVKHQWAEFQIGSEKCVVCSDGATLAANFKLGSERPVPLFLIQFRPKMDRRQHLVTIDWGKDQLKVYLDARLMAHVPFIDGTD